MISRMARKSLIKPIPAVPRDWKVSVDGVLLPRTNSVVIDHPKIGTLTYGETPQGYDGWAFHEEGGGGSVVLPFVILKDELFVAVVLQDRPNQGGKVLNAPRGFLDPGEDRCLGAARELAEEVGLRPSPSSIFALPGTPGNPNSTFFETWDEGEGVTFFGIEVAEDQVAYISETLCFKPGALDRSPPAKHKQLVEKIFRAQFMTWMEAAKLGDLFTNAAVARLLVHLRDQGHRTAAF